MTRVLYITTNTQTRLQRSGMLAVAGQSHMIFRKIHCTIKVPSENVVISIYFMCVYHHWRERWLLYVLSVLQTFSFLAHTYIYIYRR